MCKCIKRDDGHVKRTKLDCWLLDYKRMAVLCHTSELEISHMVARTFYHTHFLYNVFDCVFEYRIASETEPDSFTVVYIDMVVSDAWRNASN